MQRDLHEYCPSYRRKIAKRVENAARTSARLVNIIFLVKIRNIFHLNYLN